MQKSLGPNWTFDLPAFALYDGMVFNSRRGHSVASALLWLVSSVHGYQDSFRSI